jgi:hypothetical protein
LLARIAALPGPPWLGYAVVFAVLAAIGLVARPLANVELSEAGIAIALFEVSIPLFFMAALGWLNSVAWRALGALGPALTIDSSEVDRLGKDLVRTPARGALVGVAAGALFSFGSIVSGPESYGLFPGVGGAMWVWEFTLTAFAGAIIFAFVAHTVHQLRLVAQIHRDNVRVDLFALDPLYAFASLTSWTGFLLFAGTAYTIGGLYLVGGIQVSTWDYVMFVGLMLFATTSFVLPLRGLHDRIVGEKARHQAAASEVQAATVTEIQARIRAGDYDRMSQLNDALAATTSAAAVIGRIPTWPWRPETIRGFAGAIGLPVLVWFITSLLGRFI